ncbi:hypothetical protein [Streptomyces huiliensis]|uniref:hypothetical protein n=1 Tax=Streptomyces huiliensis TaxID=2876027 RepID=UPI001CBCB2FE|nr:hypothetical protein [Streptomyces huiliensis]MBZ4322416.1 hypothetical protein [Streptomyces huiliensis]
MNGDDRDRVTGGEEEQRARLRLPGFVNDADVGLGDLVKRATRATGLHPCGGCERRAAALNRWLVFSGKGGRRT